MKLITTLLAGAAAALAIGAASAASATVEISFDGSTALAGGTFGNGAYNYTANCASGCGGFSGIQVSGDTDALPTLLHSATVDATTSNGAAADITVWVTRTNITSPSYDLFASSFTSNNTPLFPAPTTPFTVTMTTYISTSDALFGGTELSSFTNNSPGSTSVNDLANFDFNGMTPYSVTQEYHISATAFDTTESTSPTIILSGAAVPEPATWGLMLVGFGGMGAMLRRRRIALAA